MRLNWALWLLRKIIRRWWKGERDGGQGTEEAQRLRRSLPEQTPPACRGGGGCLRRDEQSSRRSGGRLIGTRWEFSESRLTGSGFRQQVDGKYKLRINNQLHSAVSKRDMTWDLSKTRSAKELIKNRRIIKDIQMDRCCWRRERTKSFVCQRNRWSKFPLLLIWKWYHADILDTDVVTWCNREKNPERTQTLLMDIHTAGVWKTCAQYLDLGLTLNLENLNNFMWKFPQCTAPNLYLKAAGTFF